MDLNLIPAESLTSWATRQTNELWTVAKLVITIGVGLFMAVKAFQAGFGIARIIMLALTAALVLWLTVYGGLEVVGELIKEQGAGK